MMRIAINVAVFYVAWFAAVLAAARGWALEATLASIAVVVIHLMLESNRRRELAVIAMAGLAGIIVETTMVQSGLAVYAAEGPVPGFAPAWLVGMWMAFGTMFNVSLNWMKSRLWLAVLFAAIGGPVSYYAGMKMGGMTIAEPLWTSLGLLAVMWAIAFPLLLVYARRHDAAVAA
jgi:Protein of unknown function (DUF2878)